MSVSTSTEGLCDRMKAATEERHRRVERHGFQSALMQSQLPREAYLDYLGQMLLIHAALEAALMEAAAVDSRVKQVMRDRYIRTADLRDDLAYYGGADRANTPLPATADLISLIQADTETAPHRLLGYLYVLEGSNNGAKYIARAVQRAFKLPAGYGIRFLDPHGEHQREYWLTFRADVDSQDWDERTADEVIGAAQDLFDAVYCVFDQLMEKRGLMIAAE